MTLDELKAQRDELLAAINSGALMIRHGDKSIQYQTTAAMQAALRTLEATIAKAEGRKRRRQRYAYASGKGL